MTKEAFEAIFHGLDYQQVSQLLRFFNETRNDIYIYGWDTGTEEEINNYKKHSKAFDEYIQETRCEFLSVYSDPD